MRMSYSQSAQFLLFLVKWTDCHLAGALGLINILVYKVHLLVCYVSSWSLNSEPSSQTLSIVSAQSTT
jgi:hypothetical protein